VPHVLRLHDGAAQRAGVRLLAARRALQVDARARDPCEGEARRRSDACAHGDRIELYRALKRDARQRRRERVARERRAPR